MVVVKVRGNVFVGFFCVFCSFIFFSFLLLLLGLFSFFFRREGVFWVGLFAFDSSLIV